MRNARDFDHVLRRVNLAFAAVGGAILLIVSVILIFDVTLRYGFNSPTMWANDIARFLLVYVVFLGLALALHDGAHVSVDLFLTAFSERTQWVLRALGEILVAIFGFFLTWQTTAVMLESIQFNWLSTSYLGLPLKYVYLAGPVGGALFTLTAVWLVVRRVLVREASHTTSLQSEA